MGIFSFIRDKLKERRETRELIEVEAMASKLTDVGYKLNDTEPTELYNVYLERKSEINDQLVNLEENFRKTDSKIEEKLKKINDRNKDMKELKAKHKFLLGMPGSIIARALPIVAGLGLSAALPMALPFLGTLRGLSMLANLPTFAMVGAQAAIPLLATAFSGKLDIRKPSKYLAEHLPIQKLSTIKTDLEHFRSCEREIKQLKEAIKPLEIEKQKMLRDIKEKGEKEQAAENDFAIIKSAIKAKYEKNKTNVECLKYYKEYQEDMRAMASNAGIPEQLFANIERGKNNLLNGATQPFDGVTTKAFFAGLKQLRKNLMLYQTSSIDRNTLLEKVADLQETFESRDTNSSTRRRPEPRRMRERRERSSANLENSESRDADSEENTHVDGEIESEENPTIKEDKSSIAKVNAKARDAFYTGFGGEGKLNTDAFNVISKMFNKNGFMRNDDILICIAAYHSPYFKDNYLNQEESKAIDNMGIIKAADIIRKKIPQIQQNGQRAAFINKAVRYFESNKSKLAQYYRNELDRINAEKEKDKAVEQQTIQVVQKDDDDRTNS